LHAGQQRSMPTRRARGARRSAPQPSTHLAAQVRAVDVVEAHKGIVAAARAQPGVPAPRPSPAVALLAGLMGLGTPAGPPCNAAAGKAGPAQLQALHPAQAPGTALAPDKQAPGTALAPDKQAPGTALAPDKQATGTALAHDKPGGARAGAGPAPACAWVCSEFEPSCLAASDSPSSSTGGLTPRRHMVMVGRGGQA